MRQSSMKRISRCLLLAVLVAVAFLGGILSTHTVQAAHAATGTSISPKDPNINYVGRWDTSSSSVAIIYWSGAYFRTYFTGKTVKIQLATTGANIWVTIDGGKDVRYKSAKGTINLTPTPLAAGTHLLRVAAERETDLIHFQGMTLDAGAKTIAPPTTSQLIEFVGDSISAGGTQLVQGTDTNSSNQWWKIQASGGYYSLVNNRDGLAIDVQNQSTTQGAAVIRATASSATSQQWQLTVV